MSSSDSDDCCVQLFMLNLSTVFPSAPDRPQDAGETKQPLMITQLIVQGFLSSQQMSCTSLSCTAPWWTTGRVRQEITALEVALLLLFCVYTRRCCLQSFLFKVGCKEQVFRGRAVFDCFNVEPDSDMMVREREGERDGSWQLLCFQVHFWKYHTLIVH